MAEFRQRVDRHDHEIAAIRKLILTGTKMLVANEKQLRELTAQQREASKELQAFIRSRRRGGNGHLRGRTIQ